MDERIVICLGEYGIAADGDVRPASLAFTVQGSRCQNLELKQAPVVADRLAAVDPGFRTTAASGNSDPLAQGQTYRCDQFTM